jgi:hypothetical protein
VITAFLMLVYVLLFTAFLMVLYVLVSTFKLISLLSIGLFFSSRIVLVFLFRFSIVFTL